MSDQQVPSAPDYSPMINSYNSIAGNAQQQGQDALTWAKGQVANNQNLVDHISKGLLDLQGQFTDAAGKTLANAQGLQNDATDYLKSQRARFTDPNYVSNDMGAAEANVGQAADAARNSNIQQLESYGVNPGATRFGALDIGTRMQEAAAKASAGTQAARNDQTLADNANAAILGQGNTLAGQANQNAGTATGAGTAATSGNLAQTASGANVLGTDLAWTGAQTGALGGATNAQNTGFNNQAQADQIANSSSSGLGSLLGVGASMLGKGGAFASGGALAFLEEGGRVPGAGNPGGAIPDSVSPSGGAVTDDIPATAPGAPPIRLNGGEFVIPRDVVAWEGERNLQALIQKARAGMEKGGNARAQQKQAGPAVGGPAVGGPGPAVGGPPPMQYAGGGAIPMPRPRPRFTDFRRSDDIEDRRDMSPQESARGATATPGYVEEDEDYNKARQRPSGLASQLGAVDLDRDVGAALLRRIMDDHQKGAVR